MKQDEIKKVFFSDIQDKKRTRSGVYCRKGKGVKHKASGIWFPSDFLTEKELKELNGKVIVYNLNLPILNQIFRLYQKNKVQKFCCTFLID